MEGASERQVAFDISRIRNRGGELRVTADPFLLGPGIHKGMITILAPGAVNSPQQVKVILEVGGRICTRVSGPRDTGSFPSPSPATGPGPPRRWPAASDGASPAGIWIVGVTLDDGTCELNFPGPGGSIPRSFFSLRTRTRNI